MIVKITDERFVNEDGQVINYKRFNVIGVINGEVQTLKLKISKTEAMLAQMLIDSTEPVPENVTTTHQTYKSPKKELSLAEEAEKAQLEAEAEQAKQEFRQGFDV